MSGLLILLCGLAGLLVIAFDIVSQLPMLDKFFHFILQDSTLFSCMTNIVMVTKILRIIALMCEGPNVRRNGENPEILILVVDHQAQYLTVLRSWVLIIVIVVSIISIPSLILLAITISIDFCHGSIFVNLERIKTYNLVLLLAINN